MIYGEPICINCKHLHKNEFGMKCDAFPAGVPDSITMETNKHDEPIKGQDNDIVFEPVKKDLVE